MGLTVMVTGGSGLVGSYVLRQLAENGDTAINLDMREPGPEATWWLKPVADQVRSVSGGVDSWSDLAAAIMTHKPDAIIHIAAVVNQPLLNKRPALAKDINFGGTFNVLEAARLLAIKWVVYFSSIAVLPGIQYEPVDVNHPVFLGTEGPGGGFYAAAKAASEAFCWAYHQAFGVDFIVLRPSAVHGFGTRYPIYVKPMVENSVRGLPTRFERGREFPRDYTHAADVAQAAVRAAHVPPDKIKDRVFFAATGLPLVTAGGESHPDRPLLERQRLLADQSKRPGSRRPGAGDTRSLGSHGRYPGNRQEVQLPGRLWRRSAPPSGAPRWRGPGKRAGGVLGTAGGGSRNSGALGDLYALVLHRVPGDVEKFVTLVNNLHSNEWPVVKPVALEPGEVWYYSPDV